MNANHLTALGAGPPLLFISNKVSYATFFYGLEIVDHAHAILGSIALIQMVQPCAWKAFTTEAVLDFLFGYLFTVFYFARDAGF